GAREQPTRAQRGERGQRAAQTKGGLAAGAHELQSLHDELDLANAAGPELDVALVALAPSLLADLAVDVAQACVCVEVEILAEDERRDQLLEILAAVAG